MSAEPASRPATRGSRGASVRDAARAWWVPVVVVAGVLAVHGIVAWGTVLPHFQADEVGMVGNSLRIAHPSTSWELMGGSYMPGLAFLMAPAWWFTDDAVTVFHVGLAINVALAGLAVWPLALVARDAGANRNLAVVAAGVVSVAPAMSLSSNYLIAEHLLVLLTATTTHLAWRMSEHPSGRLALTLGSCAGLAFLAHGRASVVPLAAIGVALWQWRSWRRLSGVVIVSAVGSSVLAYGAYALIAKPMYADSSREQGVWSNFTSIGIVDAVRAAIGQAWYATLAWPAVAILGAIVVVSATKRHASAQLLTVTLIGTMLVSVTQTYAPPSPEPRMDVWIYGRYNDHVVAILAVVGLVSLSRRLTMRVAAWVMAVSAAVGVAFLTVTVPRIPVGGWFVDVHVAGVAPYLDLDNVYDKQAERWPLLTAFALVLTVVVLVAATRRAAHLVALGVLWSFQSISYDHASLDARDGSRDAAVADPFGVRDFPHDARFGYVDGGSGGFNMLVMTAWPRELTHATVEDIANGKVVGVDIVYVASLGGERPPPGVVVLEPRSGFGLQVWVLPGDVADRVVAGVHPPELQVRQ